MPYYRHHPQRQWHPQHRQQQQRHPQHQQHQGHEQQHQHPHQGYQYQQGQPQGYPGSFPVPNEQQMIRQLTIEDAIGIAREQVDGQVVQAELERKGGRLIFEVDIITQQGRKYEIEIDASTGEVIDVDLD